jgi:hypothetical protein
MPSPLIVTPERLDAATAAILQSRHKKLLRIVEGKGARMRVLYVCTAIQAGCAVAALLAGERRAAMIIGMQACMLISFAFVANKAAQSKALRELQEMRVST